MTEVEVQYLKFISGSEGIHNKKNLVINVYFISCNVIYEAAGKQDFISQSRDIIRLESLQRW